MPESDTGSPSRLEASLTEILLRRAGEGDAKATEVLAAMVRQQRAAEEAMGASARLDAVLAGDPLECVRYLARHGETETGAMVLLGRELTAEEDLAFAKSRRLRILEVREIQFREALIDPKRIQPWMSR